MSVPAPPPPHNDRSISTKFAARKQRERRRRRGTILVSVLLHGIVAVLVIHFTPWRQLMDEAAERGSRATRAISSKEAERLDERIEELNARQMRRQIATLQELQRRIESVERESKATYEPHLQIQRQTAPEKAMEAASKAVEAMKRAQSAMDQGNTAMVQAEQNRAEQLQQEALGQLTLLPVERIGDAVRAQEAASDAQQQAGDPVRDSDEGLQPAEIQKIEREAAQAQARIQHQQKIVADTRKTVGQEDATIRRSAEAIARQQQELEEVSDQKQRGRINTSIRREQKRLKIAEQRREMKRAKIQKHQAIADRMTMERLAGLAKLRQATDRAAEQLVKARNLQQEALTAQEEVLAKIEEAASRVLPAAEPEAETREAPPASERPDGTSIADLYETAEQTEQALTDAFENIRAMELAVIRDTSLPQARKSVDDVTPIRDGIDRDALGIQAETGQQVTHKREAVAQALREIQSMVDLALLLEAQLTHEAGGEGAGRLALALAGSASEAEVGHDEGEPLVGEKAMPAAEIGPRPGGRLAALPGRRIGSMGDAADWLGIDSWYVIGPWDNTGRRNLNRQFPPESILDLDAVYLGKDGELIRWEFVNNLHPQAFTRPLNSEPYGVWYAATEIHLESAQTLWVALGSDDRGTLWVNGRQVWLSSPEHKIWKAMEAVIPVDFQAGRNQLLLRCENGQHEMGFSMSIRL